MLKRFIVGFLIDTGLFTEEIHKLSLSRLQEYLSQDDHTNIIRDQEYNRGLHDGRAIYQANLRKNLDTDKYFIEKCEEYASSKLEKLLTIGDYRSIVMLDKVTRKPMIKGEIVEAGRLGNLRAEADFLMESDLWKLLQETPKDLASKAMFISSESLDDMKKGKSMLYLLDIQQKIVDMFKTQR